MKLLDFFQGKLKNTPEKYLIITGNKAGVEALAEILEQDPELNIRIAEIMEIRYGFIVNEQCFDMQTV